MTALDIESVTCPDCGRHFFTIKHIPSAGTYYLLCFHCHSQNKDANKFITTELINVSIKSKGEINVECKTL